MTIKELKDELDKYDENLEVFYKSIHYNEAHEIRYVDYQDKNVVGYDINYKPIYCKGLVIRNCKD